MGNRCLWVSLCEWCLRLWHRVANPGTLERMPPPLTQPGERLVPRDRPSSAPPGCKMAAPESRGARPDWDMAAAEGAALDAENEREEVEEQLVMVELSGIIDSDFLEKCENKCKILGIDTDRPILQVDRYVFAGQYEDALGTCVVFEENAEHVDAEGNQKVQLKYKCHTMKKLNMTRTLLTEKKEEEETVGGVEWLQIKDKEFSYSRPNMICSFLREKEDSEEAAPTQEKLTEESEEEVSDRGNSDLSYELEKEQSMDNSVPLPDRTASKAENLTSDITQDITLDVASS